MWQAVVVTGREADLPSVGAFLGSVGTADSGRASSGVVAALAVALAADLASQVARASAGWDERGGALAQADAIRDRAVALAAELQRTYGTALTALERSVDAGADVPGAAGADLGAALRAVIDPLERIGEAAGDAAELAAHVARAGATLVRADAVAATMLATAAAEIVAHLIEVNLLVDADDERSLRAREWLAAAVSRREVARSLPR